MQSGDKGPDPERLSESEKRRFSKYGTLQRGGLFGQKSKERTFFDSGDFALSAADRVTDNGAIHTGKMHPRRDSISHPYAPIPASCNVDKDANEDANRKSASPEKSPLLQRTNTEDQLTNKEGQENPVFHQG
ncbi:hypothetical protein N7510_005849 [Penicillium lagena]|uniref:uncharacterized protein n=1 Tax=Penicillium lagena TaxID=94218 RepID=UPI00253F774F|nr:uncharacterized protein N7510_005849 [Penicillium lagena]KAJ5612655.1 hypothetical protein N7510_005849 [Penicillium lagena]